jgi:transcriptional regulator with XRE-family HTH domain
MNVGKAIKMCRNQRGMSLDKLSEKAGCSASYLSMLENNKRDPALSTIKNIANALQVPIGIIFFLASEGNELTGIDRTLSGELARTTLELLNAPIQPEV